MNKLCLRLLVLFISASINLIASDPYLEDISAENTQETAPGGPFTIKISGDYIGNAKFSCDDYRHFSYALCEADVNMVYYYNPCFKEAATIGLTFSRSHLNWKHNPFFTQKNINWIGLNFGGITERIQDWTWRAQISVNFDNIEYWNFQDYMNYDLLLWGRYAYTPNFGVHIGIMAFTGMKMDRVYPIVGIDWTYNCQWKLNLVFPMDISLLYTIDDCWSIALAGRMFNDRHRVKKDQFYSEGLWFYTSSGAELAVKYQAAQWISANVHAGYDFGGHLKIATRHYRNGQRLRFESASYAGGEISLNF